MSNAKNLATLTSLIAFNIKEDYQNLEYFLFKFPAVTNTLLTALIP